jgi:hypothetical protein
MVKVKLEGESKIGAGVRVEIELEFSDLLKQLNKQGRIAHTSYGQLVLCKEPVYGVTMND